MGKIILRLDRVMADRKMSLNELSERVGVSNVNLSKMKTGKISAIRFSTLEAICEVLHCQPGDILEYTIVGLTGEAENTSLISFDYEDSPIFLNVPLTSLENSLGLDLSEDNMSANILLADDADSKTVCNEAINILESRHNCKGEDAYMIQSFSDSMATINTVINTITLFIALVAAISLLIGGVGVMNIMLVSVTERTREIGIRKALGARTGSIMLQFLSESAIITMLGGILGILFGIGGAFLISGVVKIAAPTYAFTPSISFGAILLATLFSSVVGIFFGIYPARKAAKLSPIEALRRM